MKTKERQKKLIGLGIAAAVCVTLWLLTADLIPIRAAERVDPSHNASLTLEYQQEGKNLSGADFRLYRVAEISDAARFTLSGDFAQYKIIINDLDAEGWNIAAQTLSAYVTADKITALETGTTNQEGRLKFNSNRTGLYLVTGDRIERGNTAYTVKPFLVSLPVTEEDDIWNYDVISRPKCSIVQIPPPDEDNNSYSTWAEVLKIWEDDGNEENRPDSISVSLLRNGDVYDQVILNEGNYWRYTWNFLDIGFNWSVVETGVPEGYTVTYTGSSTQLFITNTATSDIPDEPPPATEGITTETPSETPSDTDLPDDPEIEIPDNDIPEGGGLPQTGMLWWPVPVLALFGMAVFGIGWADTFRQRRNKK